MRYISLTRIALTLIGLGGILFAPIWVPLIVVAILALRYQSWEALLIGVLADLIWLPQDFIVPLPLFTITALFLVWVLEPIRKELLV